MRYFMIWTITLVPLTAYFYLAGLLLRDGTPLRTILGTLMCLAGAVVIGLLLRKDLAR